MDVLAFKVGTFQVKSDIAVGDILFGIDDLSVISGVQHGLWQACIIGDKENNVLLMLAIHSDYAIELHDDFPWIRIGELDAMPNHDFSVIAMLDNTVIKSDLDYSNTLDNMPIAPIKALGCMVGQSKFGFATSVPSGCSPIIQATMGLSGKIIALRVIIENSFESDDFDDTE